MVCSEPYDSHEWVWEDGRMVCPECGTVDLTTARLRRDVITAATEAGLLRPLDERPP